MSKTEIVNSIPTVAETTDSLLNAGIGLRLHHFCIMKHNNASEFEVAFLGGCLCFSTDRVTPKEIRAYEKIFRAYSRARYVDSTGQEERWQKVVDRFGNDGANALNDMFFYVADKEKKTRQASGGRTVRRAGNGN